MKNDPLKCYLMPCPFCAGTDMIGKVMHEDYFFRCMTCTATGPNGSDWESAVYQWNNREIPESPLIKILPDNILKRKCLRCDKAFLTTPEKRICALCSQTHTQSDAANGIETQKSQSPGRG